MLRYIFEDVHVRFEVAYPHCSGTDEVLKLLVCNCCMYKVSVSYSSKRLIVPEKDRIQPSLHELYSIALASQGAIWLIDNGALGSVSERVSVSMGEIARTLGKLMTPVTSQQNQL